ncbi:MAG: hypothetical protein QOE70_2096 [Chthoniobacter sp.]|jgi:hypothetical protein|nr:hypothetical protein [Chthoniobacter sp.]
MSEELESAESLVDRLELPHKRVRDWIWRPDAADPQKPMISRDRLIHYATQLRMLGMSDGDISGLFSDLYWDSYNECLYNECFKQDGPVPQ